MEYGMINNMGGLEEELIKSAKAIDELAKTTYLAIKQRNTTVGEEELAICAFVEGLRSAVLAQTLKNLIDKWAIIEREVDCIAGRNEANRREKE